MDWKNSGQCLAEKLSAALCRLLSQCNCLGKWISEQQRGLFGVRQALRAPFLTRGWDGDRQPLLLSTSQTRSTLKAVADGWVVIAWAHWEGSHGNSSFQSYRLSLSATRWVWWQQITSWDTSSLPTLPWESASSAALSSVKKREVLLPPLAYPPKCAKDEGVVVSHIVPEAKRLCQG